MGECVQYRIVLNVFCIGHTLCTNLVLPNEYCATLKSTALFKNKNMNSNHIIFHFVHHMVVKKTTIHSLHILNNATVKRLGVRRSILRQENDFCMLQLTANLVHSIGMHSGIVHKEQDLPLRILGSNLLIEPSKPVLKESACHPRFLLTNVMDWNFFSVRSFKGTRVLILTYNQRFKV